MIEQADFAQILQSCSEGCLLLEPDFRVSFANQAAQHLVREPECFLLDRSLWDVFPTVDREGVRRTLESGRDFVSEFENGLHFLCLRITNQSGVLVAWLTASPPKHFEGPNRHTTPHSEFDHTSETLGAIIDRSPIAIVATDAAGEIKIWNPAAESILGYPRREVIGKPPPFSFEIGEETGGREYRALRKDGKEIDIFCSLAPMYGDQPRDMEGERTSRGFVAMFMDITESKRFREHIEQTQKLESLGVLAGGLAHDFNNLLTGIMGNASLARFSLSEDHESRPLIEEIVRSGERAAALTRQLLAYAGKSRFVATRVDLSELTNEIATLARASIGNKRVKLALDLDPNLPPVEADTGQVQQVILNLVMNAVEAFHERGSGVVRVVTRTEFVSGSVAQSWETGVTLPAGLYAVLEVHDTGMGMDEDTRRRVFEPFFSTKFTGRGLGLPAVLGIVRQHHGALSVQSTPGEGSVFRVLLPPLQHPVAEVVPLDTNRKLEGAGLVLLVDDEETVRNTARRSLEHWRYSVVLAENGQAALEVFPKISSQLAAIILDLTMPVMGGEETLKHFRRLRPDLPILLTSGYSESEAMRRVHRKDVSAFLQKPFTAEQLGRKLRTLLEPPPKNTGKPPLARYADA